MEVLNRLEMITGKRFKFYKFRSMIMNAEAKTGVVLAKKDDSRITKVGKFIFTRRYERKSK